PPRCELLYGEWLRSEFEQGAVPEPGPSPDLAVLVTMVHQGNAPLVGPPPGEVLDPVPPADLARAVVAGVPDLLADLEHDTRNVILTLLRIWTTARCSAGSRSRAQSAAASFDWISPVTMVVQMRSSVRITLRVRSSQRTPQP